MTRDTKQRLTDLGAETLADALLDLASRIDEAEALVDRLVSTPGENVRRIKARLAGLKRSRRFVHWGESAGLARDLESLLGDIRVVVKDPVQGVELVASFFETDKGTLGRCDDSSGHVGDVYRFSASDLFGEFASNCADKKWLVNLLLKVNRVDDYGVRDRLIDHAVAYLPEPDIRKMISRLQALADRECDEYKKRHWLRLIESLADQIKDAELFEKTRLASWGKPSTAACVDIARVYLKSGNADSALSWMERIPEDGTFMEDERDQLLLDIHGARGEKEKQIHVAWQMFQRRRSTGSLRRLLAFIGEEKRDAVVAGEVAKILDDENLSLTDARFLIKSGRYDDAERYLIERADQLDGDLYDFLLPLAETMESEQRALAASLIYRALLDSILRRGQTKTYHHGVRYLKRLDGLEGSVPDWRGLEDHHSYHERLRLKHGRKTSFWSRYEN